ncbi:MAG: hypothetical protein ACOYWZ_11070 [Bacillota bacterium]
MSTMHSVQNIFNKIFDETAGSIATSGGGGGGGATDKIYDADGTTQIQTQETAAEEKLRFDTNGVERMVIDNNGNVSIGSVDANQKVTIGGTLKVNSNYISVLDYYISDTPANGVKIKTNIPFSNMNGMPTIIIEGYAYGASRTWGIMLNWYIFGDAFTYCSASSFGGRLSPIKLARENGKVVIFIDDKVYFGRFTVRTYCIGQGTNSSWYAGWTVADEAITGDKIIDVYYHNKVGELIADNGILVNGNVGIGIALPVYTLDLVDGMRVNCTNSKIFITGDKIRLKNTNVGLTTYPKIEWCDENDVAPLYIGGGDKTSYIEMGLQNSKNLVITGGNVGIGQTQPNVPLHFATTHSDKIRFYGNTYGLATKADELTIYKPSAVGFAIRSDNQNGSCPFKIKSDGKVGILTDDPQAYLDINKKDAYGILSLRSGDGLSGNFGITQIRFGYNNTPDYPHFITTRHNAGSAVDNAIDFYTCDGTSAGVFPTNAILGLTVENGQVVVGGGEPAATLTVSGVTALKEVAAPTATANYGKLYVKTDSSLYFMSDTGVETNLVTSSIPTYIQDVAGTTKIQTEESANEQCIRFDTNGVQRMIINPDGKIGIGTATPNACALIEMNATSQGLLLPRMSAAQRDAIPSPIAGLMVFCTDDAQFYGFSGVSWVILG